MIETSQLQTLVAVAETSSFSKAADALGVTQSAISQSIKNLEARLDLRLFDRTGKKVILTTEGEKLYNLATSFLTKIEETIDEIQYDKDEMSGKVRLGTLNGIGKSWLAPELLSLSIDNPELTIEIRLGFQEDLVRQFEDHQLDFLILPSQGAPAIGEKIYLGEERSTLVFPQDPRYLIDEKTSLEELSSYPTVLFSNGDPLYLYWCRSRFGEVPKKINSRYIINSHANMLQAVHQGLGVAVVPTHVFRRSFYREKVRSLPHEFDVIDAKFFMFYHKESVDRVRIKKTLDKLTAAINQLSSIM